jgi:hypothetical protein
VGLHLHFFSVKGPGGRASTPMPRDFALLRSGPLGPRLVSSG